MVAATEYTTGVTVTGTPGQAGENYNCYRSWHQRYFIIVLAPEWVGRSIRTALLVQQCCQVSLNSSSYDQTTTWRARWYC